MKIPKKIWVCGQVFNVIYRKKVYDEHGTELLGLCDTNKCIVYLKKGLTPEKKKEVFLHEFCHALFENLNIPMGEDRVNNFTLVLLDFLRRNKLDFRR